MTAAPLAAPALLDGAMGTALIARGLPAGALPEEWLVSRPEEIAAVHAEHAAAGAAVLLTCTFSCAAPRLDARLGGAAPVEELCRRAVRLAREAAGARGLVAGAVGPADRGVPAAERAARYRRAFAALAGAGADLLWIESQWELPEALGALAEARATGLAAVVTFGHPEAEGTFRGPDGEATGAYLAAAEKAGAAAAGVNCVPAGRALAALVRWARAALRVPLVAKPSPGLPGAVLPPAAFAAALRPATEAGLTIAGGCCGATGDHLRAIAPLLLGAA